MNNIRSWVKEYNVTPYKYSRY